ncbi:zinc-binding dehydrogenase [Colletotrichum tamarilloi]|uniref:Zinc-binding dehydrogenase n=1 Tax=Colletotrichum tamarilloi TaxID=1209934 RepID=A0ABQ9QM40_9PEZI|nr:zinc-binding dehydrogenase [Colletotrichum tamarilloi]KAK1477411.1 zinc-binding dehydrogenase [Colletotrichum tamarilloi]
MLCRHRLNSPKLSQSFRIELALPKMAILHLLTLGLTAAAMASPAPSNDATPTDPKEALVRKGDWDNYLKYKASLGTQASGQAAVQRICDLVLCLGPNHTGECSLWCHYKGELQSFEEAKQREITMSTYFTKSDRCNFYAKVCEPVPHGDWSSRLLKSPGKSRRAVFRLKGQRQRQAIMSTDTQVQCWQTRQDGLDNLFLATASLPQPGPGEVLVKISAVSLNYRDTEVAMGLYNHHKTIKPAETDPIVPASDMCGSVVSVGDGVSRWKAGDRVLSIFNQTHLKGQIKPVDMKSGLGFPLEGVLQTYRVFSAEGLVRAPKHLSDEEAATLPIAAVTAWMSINQFRPLGQPGGQGEVVVCQGTGGVAISGLQIAKASGATVIVTSSSDEKLEKAKALGADYTVNYRTTPNWDDKVNEFTEGEGANLILETGGAKTLRQSFEAIGFGGQIACIGYLSGKVDDVEDRTNVNLLALKKTVTLKGIINGPRERFEEMIEFYEEKGIKPVVDRVFQFKEADKAYNYLYSGGHFGKVVVKVQE